MAAVPVAAAAPAPPQPPARPNYAALHARPLPLAIHPLPPFIPHNPLSLFYLLAAYFTQALHPPTSHPTIYRGYFDGATRSVHITDAAAVRGLWEHGFFGKGSLSRSEPTWRVRELRRLGLVAQETAEEVTARRRAERKHFKAERARKERERIEMERGNGRGEDEGVRRGKLEEATGHEPEEATTRHEPEDASLLDVGGHESARKARTANTTASHPPIAAHAVPTPTDATVVDQEHLQLELVEAFFLVYALGVLEVVSPSTHQRISTPELLRLFCAHASFPPLVYPSLPHAASTEAAANLYLFATPDNPFLLAYVAYHHFRSLGWVVRSGVKFSADWLLYHRGPAFAHAEFAVVVVPSYSDAWWATEDARRAHGDKAAARKPWHWLHMVNRVQAQVRKALVLCYVRVPPPEQCEGLDIGRLLQRYSVREMVIRRWVPNRSRD